MKAKAKKLLSLIMAMAMCLSLLQGVAFAEDTTAHHYVVESVEIDKDGNVTVNRKCDAEGHTDKPEAEKLKDKAAVDTETKATCGKNGTIVYKVTVEGKEYKSDQFVTDKATGQHTWTEETIVDQAATCEEGGKVHVKKTCSVCGAVEEGKQTETAALGHDYKTTYEELKNVTIDDKGTVTLVDKTKDGSYVEVKTCQNGTAHTGENPTKETKTVKATTDTADQGEVKKETVKDGNVEISEDGKTVSLIDCSKPGKYNEVTYDTKGNVLKTEEKSVPAGHTAAKAVAEKVSENVEISYDKDGKIVATNKSCATEGSYEAVVYCTNKNHTKKVELSRTKVTVAKSDKHTPAADFKYENDTATCQKDGTKDKITYCAVCGKELKRESVKSEKHAHEGKDPVIENEKAPTAHNTGSYDSVIYCKWGGEELKRTTVTVPATNKDEYTWSYEVEWSNPDCFVGSVEGHYFNGKDMPTEPTATLVAKPTDSDLTADQGKALTTKFKLTVKEETAEAVKGDACHLGSKTWSVSVDKKFNDKKGQPVEADNGNKAVKLESKQAYNYAENGYKGHYFGAAVYTVVKEATETEDGQAAYRRTCAVCGDHQDDYYVTIPATGKKDDTTPDPTAKTSISDAVIKGSAPYRGEYFNVPFTVTLDGKKLALNKDYVITNTQQNNFKGVGSHKITIEGIGSYTGVKSGKLYITETAQNVTVTPAKKTFTVKTLKKKAASFKISVKGAKGAVSYKSNNKKVTVSKAGKVTVKKGTKKGTYKVTVKVAKKGGFKAATKTVTIVVK